MSALSVSPCDRPPLRAIQGDAATAESRLNRAKRVAEQMLDAGEPMYSVCRASGLTKDQVERLFFRGRKFGESSALHTKWLALRKEKMAPVYAELRPTRGETA